MSNENLKKSLIEIIEKVVGTKVKDDDSLIESRLIDSMGIIDLTLELEEIFNIKIHATEVNVENFETIYLLTKFIENKQKGV